MTRAATLAYLGRAEESREWIAKAGDRMPGEPNIREVAALLAAVCGDQGPAKELAAELESLEGWKRKPGRLAMIYCALGDLDRAFREAENMIDLRAARAHWIISPAHRPLQRHPRFPELLRRMRLPTSVLVARA